MRLSYAVINPKLVSQSSILAHPAYVRWAWLSLIVEGQISDGVIRGLTAFQLSKLATITLAEAKESLAIFTAPDEFSANKANDGQRLELIDEATNTYRLVSYDYHDKLITKAKDADRKRVEYYKHAEKSGETGDSPNSSESLPPFSENSTTDTDTDTAPLPRESKAKTKLVSAEKRKSAEEMVEAFELTDQLQAEAVRKYPLVDVVTETAQWRERLRANGYHVGRDLCRSPVAAWRYWMGNAQKIAADKPRGAHGRADHAAGTDRRTTPAEDSDGEGDVGSAEYFAVRARTSTQAIAEARLHPVSPAAGRGKADSVR
jgi:hypothetical protein